MARQTIPDISKEVKFKLPCFAPVRVHPAYQLDDVDHFDSSLMKLWICKILENQLCEDFYIYEGFVELFGHPVEFDVKVTTINGELIDIVTENSIVCLTCKNITGEDMTQAILLNIFSPIHCRSVCVYNPITGIAWITYMDCELFREYAKILENTYGLNTIMRTWYGCDITLQLSAFVTDQNTILRQTFEEADMHLRDSTNRYSVSESSEEKIFFEMRRLKNGTCVVRASQHYQIPFGNIVVCGVVFLPITDEIALRIRSKFCNLFPEIIKR